ncbi:hypothetical protein LFL97_33425 [Burkholderia sp. JSH-S8]|nr:hypothetical protein LFL97_33425 [Burkholderia sp. JSH-S8]
MSKTLSYTQLTADAEQRIRQHLADAARYRAAGDHRSEHHAQALASGVCDLWLSLAVEHLDGLLRRTYADDFARLVGHWYPRTRRCRASATRRPPTGA